ncbi:MULTISPECIES: ROK family protein [unclassified Mesorhizobium]|uniref:ROK family protein n=1 Tax=unclassified Mesorhizobium TaxID=325217 RepID=UPI00333880E2
MFATIDMGGTTWKLALMQDGEPLVFAELPNTRSPEDLDRLPEVLGSLCRRAGVASCDGIGVSIAEFVDPVAGTCLPPGDTHSYLENVNLAAILHRLIGKPVSVDNDARCALLGELSAGVAQDFKDETVVLVALGTGIGVAISARGDLHYGSHSSAGTAFGHVQIDPQGPLCACGRSGCAEALISGWAISERLRERQGFGESVLAHSDPLDFRRLCEAVREGDRFAEQALEAFVSDWASMLAVLIQVADPAAMVLGGGFMQSADIFIEDLKRKTLRKLWRPQNMPVFRVVAEPKLSALRGAEVLARRAAGLAPRPNSAHC